MSNHLLRVIAVMADAWNSYSYCERELTRCISSYGCVAARRNKRHYLGVESERYRGGQIAENYENKRRILLRYGR